MGHFTYRDPDKNVLKQGDVLQKTEKIKQIIREVHPHYLKEDYLYLIVLTQTCDLVLRDNRLNSRYISLAAVRPLDLLVERKIEEYQKTPLEKRGGICDESRKNTLINFLERLLNNNEPEYFFLSEDLSYSFSQDCVAFLRLSIALKSELHFLTCLEAKVLELRDVFQAKLGWLVGQMYSRIGTEDWVPDTLPEPQFREKIDSILDGLVLWVERDRLKKSIAEYSDRANELKKEEIHDLVSKIEIPKKKEIVSSRIREILTQENLSLPNDVDKVINRIKNDPQIAQVIK